MTASSTVTVRATYTRSVNVERDGASRAVLDMYIPTNRALDTLRRVSATLASDQAVPRAWALIGPYGSGKSAFSLFLSHVLGGTGDPLNVVAKGRISLDEPELIATIDRDVGNGYVSILLTGSPESLSRRLLQAIEQKVSFSAGLKAADKKKILVTAANLLSGEHLAHSAVLALVQAFQSAVLASSGKNVLLVVDELGKFLEYEARSAKANDIHLLQSLAELASARGPATLQLVVLLHQSFDVYAKGVKAALKNEWLKVQGRFESISFIETAEQTIRLVAAALEAQHPPSFEKQIAREAKQAALALHAAGALPSLMTVEQAHSLFVACYPIHPVALLALPHLCQKVAQNERTLFTYLGSLEPFGFQSSLERFKGNGAVTWIAPSELYDYFVENQSLSLADPLTQRRWIEVSTAVDRMHQGSDQHASLLKSIGVLNLIGAQGGFKASPAVLATLLSGSSSSVSQHLLEELQAWSLIVFRKFTGEYRVWEGSDFDLESALRQQVAELAGTRLSQRLKHHRKAGPIVARRFAIETGNLRAYVRRFIEFDELTAEPPALVPQILYVLTDPSVDLLSATEALKEATMGAPLRIAALVPISEEVMAVVEEAEALRRMEVKYPQLAGDPIALRETRERLKQTESLENVILANLIEEPQYLAWIFRGESLAITGRRAFQQFLSENLKRDVFAQTPAVRNELINRNKPSSAAMGARRKLLMAMLENSAQRDLGIEKFPAEKSMYLSLLQATKIHRMQGQVWGFHAPDFDSYEGQSYRAVWEAIAGFFASAEQTPRSVGELYEILASPPFGVKEGVLPVLWLAAYLVLQDEVALFDNGVFLPALTKEALEKVLNNPYSLHVQSTAVTGMRGILLKKYGQLLLAGIDNNTQILPVVKPIARMLAGLPEFSKKTNRLSQQAKDVRLLFQKAKSPGELLFELLPKACGYSGAELNEPAVVDAFAATLRAALHELQLAYRGLLAEFESNLKSVFAMKGQLSLRELREALRGRFRGLESLTIDMGGSKAFLLRIQDTSGDDTIWLESLAAFIAKKPASKWDDAEVAIAEVRLIEFTRKILELEKLRLAFHDNALSDNGNFDVVLMKTVRPNQASVELVVHVDHHKRQLIEELKKRVLAAWSDEDSIDVKLALISELFEDMVSTKQAHPMSLPQEKIAVK
jgi:hypothetical protein